MLELSRISWSPLPDGFTATSLDSAGPIALLGGHRAERACVIQGHLDRDLFVIEEEWRIPQPPLIGSDEDAGETAALVSAAVIAGQPVAVVNIQEYQGGSWGAWYHPVGTERWEYVANVSGESDIGMGDIGIAGDVLYTFEGPGQDPNPNLYAIERRSQPWRPHSRIAAESYWHPRIVELPPGLGVTWSLAASPAWLAVQAADDTGDSILIYARKDGERLHRRIELGGHRQAQVALRPEGLVVLETLEHVRLSWLDRMDGELRELLLSEHEVHGTVDADAARVLIVGARPPRSQTSSGWVVDLTKGAVEARFELPTGAWSGGRLHGDRALLATETQVGVLALR